MKVTPNHESGFYLSTNKAERKELSAFLRDILDDGAYMVYLIRQESKPKQQTVLIPWHACGAIRQEFEDCSRVPEKPQDALSDDLFVILLGIVNAWALRNDYMEALGWMNE